MRFRLSSRGEDVPLLRTIALPERPDAGDTAEGDTAAAPSGWLLRQELPGRSDCVHSGQAVDGLAGAEEETGSVRCAPGLRIDAEEPGRFTRQLDVPEPTAVAPELLVRPRAGAALEQLLRGDEATRWMEIAQAYGGSPGPGRLPHGDQ